VTRNFQSLTAAADDDPVSAVPNGNRKLLSLG